MTRLLFWNTQKKAAEQVVAQVAAAKRADIIALAEAGHLKENLLIRELGHQCRREYRWVNGSFKIRVYSALPVDYLEVLGDLSGMVFVAARQTPSVLLVFAHLPSKMGVNLSSVSMQSTRLRPEIEKMETRVGHHRTLVMGDLNMEPYDDGVISAEALHATMCAEIARRRERRVGGQQRFYFYNPMWNLLGDRTGGPPGTFYRARSEPNALFWHMIDQVLLRPDVIDLVDVESLSIVTRATGTSLTTEGGRPDSKYSDHFPIYIAMRDFLPRRSR
jgi:hypothetical protein